MANREVITADAIEWLQGFEVRGPVCFVGSLPDFSEFQTWPLEQWKSWFTITAGLILSKTHDDGVAFFFQSDIKHEGTWVDKAYLVLKAAEQSGHQLLFHKIFCRAKPGTATFGRPAYSHLLCFSKNLRARLESSTPDVIPSLGEKSWERGMGTEACRTIARFVKEQTTLTTIINPFCGLGSMLAMANHYGLESIGIERSPKRAQKARELQLSEDGEQWIL